MAPAVPRSYLGRCWKKRPPITARRLGDDRVVRLQCPGGDECLDGRLRRVGRMGFGHAGQPDPQITVRRVRVRPAAPPAPARLRMARWAARSARPAPRPTPCPGPAAGSPRTGHAIRRRCRRPEKLAVEVVPRSSVTVSCRGSPGPATRDPAPPGAGPLTRPPQAEPAARRPRPALPGRHRRPGAWSRAGRWTSSPQHDVAEEQLAPRLLDEPPARHRPQRGQGRVRRAAAGGCRPPRPA